MSKVGKWAFHHLTRRDPERAQGGHEQPDDAYDDASTAKYLSRFGERLDFTGKTVLDVGCGTGVLAAAAIKGGAVRVVGVDLHHIKRADANARRRVPDAGDRLSFMQTAGDLSELGDQTFDLVISKDAMEHYDDPEGFVHLLADRVTPGGELVVGFGPLWKSPYGGHIEGMTAVPWVHLLFSEATIMAERRRFRPLEHATRWSEVKGGLNQMTLQRFKRVMRATGLQPVYFRTNVSDHPAVKALRVLNRFKPLREYLTVSVYGIWRKPT